MPQPLSDIRDRLGAVRLPGRPADEEGFEREITGLLTEYDLSLSEYQVGFAEPLTRRGGRAAVVSIEKQVADVLGAAVTLAEWGRHIQEFEKEEPTARDQNDRAVIAAAARDWIVAAGNRWVRDRVEPHRNPKPDAAPPPIDLLPPFEVLPFRLEGTQIDTGADVLISRITASANALEQWEPEPPRRPKSPERGLVRGLRAVFEKYFPEASLATHKPDPHSADGNEVLTGDMIEFVRSFLDELKISPSHGARWSDAALHDYLYRNG